MSVCEGTDMDNAEVVQQAEQGLFQDLDGGSTPTSPLDLFFRQIIRTDSANRVFVEKHYAHRAVPISVAYGEYKLNSVRTLVGAISFGKPASPSLCVGVCGKENSHRIYELNRLWMSEECPKNSESRFIGWALRVLKKQHPDWILVSYADTGQNHTGAIYRATGWIYTGLSDARECGDYATDGGKHSRHSTRSDKPNVPRTRKHRYVYFLNKTDVSLLKYATVKFNGGTNDQQNKV